MFFGRETKEMFQVVMARRELGHVQMLVKKRYEMLNEKNAKERWSTRLVDESMNGLNIHQAT